MGEGIPEAVLNSGEKIPMIGLGTASSPVPQDLISSFISAIETGYRHFDTAALYGSEAPLGKAIAQALQQGLVKTRDELFITSKLWCTEAHHDRVLPALKQTLQNLELDYIDLYLIHWPLSLKPGEIKFPMEINKEDLLPMDFKAVWEAMEECQRLGLVKSIGVSNFSCKKLSQIMANAKIPPAVNQVSVQSWIWTQFFTNWIGHRPTWAKVRPHKPDLMKIFQVELNPAWEQRKLRDFCKDNGIHVSAWSPLGGFGAPWGSPTVMENPVLKEIAAAKGKSTAQVSLRWIYQQGVSVIVKSFNKERMKENLEIFDWELSEEELQQISQIPQHRGFSGEILISPTGPYKTLQEFWDEDA